MMICAVVLTKKKRFSKHITFRKALCSELLLAFSRSSNDHPVRGLDQLTGYWLF